MLLVQARPQRPRLVAPDQLPDRGDQPAASRASGGARTPCCSRLGGRDRRRPGVAAYLLGEMYERLTRACTFIIDDWQFVASVTEVRGLWNQILRDAPANCRFVFLARAKPQLQFARFKTHGGYAELRTDALRFTDDEIGAVRDVYNDPLDPKELVELERRTEGWAASLQLIEVSLRERKTPEERRAFIQSITATQRQRPLRLPGGGGARPADRSDPQLPALHLDPHADHAGAGGAHGRRHDGAEAPRRARAARPVHVPPRSEDARYGTTACSATSSSAA